MYKWSQILRIICAAAWAAVFIIAIINPGFDSKLALLIAAAIIVFTNLTDFVLEREEHVRETKRPDNQP